MASYGHGFTAESIRALVDTLRSALDPPWNEQLTPHMLRHAFGYELQRMGTLSPRLSNPLYANDWHSLYYDESPLNW
jgi:hypothetical protein